jgi:uncharacterized SAM-binding protein YcdF (DUF218 family)
MGVIRRLVRWAWRLGLIVLALTVGAVMYFSDANLRKHGAGRSLEEPVDVVLVLGGGRDGDGLISFSSRRRVRVALALLEAGRTRWLIFSGGGRAGGGAPKEGDLMRDFAVSLGAAPERLLVEPGAASTFENLRFGFSLARSRGLERMAILTDAFHLERARRLAAYFGQPDAGLVAVDGLRFDGPEDRVWSILREALAWWFNLAKVAGWEALDAAGFGAAERAELIR